MKKLLFVLLFSVDILIAGAQIPSCDGNRYKNPVFGSVDSIKDIQYGWNYTMNNVFQSLKLDFYEPEGDSVKKRPLIIFMHGGGFISGGKSDLAPLCNYYAIRGFTVASIDYRLIDVPILDSNVVIEGLIQAMGDAKAAIVFFERDACHGNQYRIDTNSVFVAGLSAGGMIASHAAYLDSTDNIPPYMLSLIYENGGFLGNSSPDSSFVPRIAGVINFSGALLQQDFISTGEPVLFSAHDIGDTIVPCMHGISHGNVSQIYLDGGCAMQEEANRKGLYNGIFLNQSNGHLAYLQYFPTADSVMQRSSDFLYNVICTTIVGVNQESFNRPEFSLYPNPSENSIHIDLSDDLIEGEHIQLFNSIGILMKEIDAEPNARIDVSGMPEGLYLVHLKNHPEKPLVFYKH